MEPLAWKLMETALAAVVGASVVPVAAVVVDAPPVAPSFGDELHAASEATDASAMNAHACFILHLRMPGLCVAGMLTVDRDVGSLGPIPLTTPVNLGWDVLIPVEGKSREEVLR